jgi:hypothetical protein
MSRIKEHMFAIEENTPVYANQNSEHIIAYIPKGTWMGIVEQTGNWIQIITSNVDGWVISNSGNKETVLAKEIKINQSDVRIEYLIPRLTLKVG